MPKQLTEIGIAARVVPTAPRWPAANGTDHLVWDHLRDAVHALRTLVGQTDEQCAAAEDNVKLDQFAIHERRRAILDRALQQLAHFEPLTAAEKIVATCADSPGAKGYSARKALDELIEGVSAAERAVRQRCSNGMWDVPNVKARLGAY